MTESELKYIIAVDELTKAKGGANLTSVAERLHVTKVSVYNAVERLTLKGFFERRNGKKIYLTDEGIKQLDEYRVIICFIAMHLKNHCGMSKNIAENDALKVACAFSTESRYKIMQFIQANGMKEGKADK